jgi:hypothetical protein
VPSDHQVVSPSDHPTDDGLSIAPSRASRARSALLSKGAIAALGTLLTLMCWGLSSPPGSAPDEPYHLASAWCAWGTDTEHCKADPADPTVRWVPHQVANGQCFTGNVAQGAECRTPDYDLPLTPDQPTQVGNWQGSYPPVFYATMRLFVTDSYDTSVALMRVANAVIATGLVVGLALLLPRRLRALPGYVFVLTAVPLALFFIPSANPSSWAILSAGVLWMSVYAAYERTGRHRWALLAYGLLATVVGAGSRADAALFSILGIALAMGLRSRLLRREWQVTVSAVALAAVAAVFYLTAGHAGVAAEGLPGYPPAEMSDTQLAISNLLGVPFLWLAALGVGPLSGLGWFDTPVPYVTAVAALLAFGAGLVHGWSAMWWQKAVAVAVVGVSLMAYPVILLQESRVQAGNAVQPRYVLPMMLMLVGLSLLRRRGRVWRLNLFQVLVLAGGLAVAQSAALYSNLVRYVNGGSTALPTSMGGGWWWNGLPVSPFWLWLVGSVAFAAVAAVVLGHGLERRPRSSGRSRPAIATTASEASSRKNGR